jgi:hypothetical protein
MSKLTYRLDKESSLTYQELDDNFRYFTESPGVNALTISTPLENSELYPLGSLVGFLNYNPQLSRVEPNTGHRLFVKVKEDLWDPIITDTVNTDTVVEPGRGLVLDTEGVLSLDSRINLIWNRQVSDVHRYRIKADKDEIFNFTINETVQQLNDDGTYTRGIISSIHYINSDSDIIELEADLYIHSIYNSETRKASEFITEKYPFYIDSGTLNTTFQDTSVNLLESLSTGSGSRARLVFDHSLAIGASKNIVKELDSDDLISTASQLKFMVVPEATYSHNLQSGLSSIFETNSENIESLYNTPPSALDLEEIARDTSDITYNTSTIAFIRDEVFLIDDVILLSVAQELLALSSGIPTNNTVLYNILVTPIYISHEEKSRYVWDFQAKYRNYSDPIPSISEFERLFEHVLGIKKLTESQLSWYSTHLLPIIKRSSNPTLKYLTTYGIDASRLPNDILIKFSEEYPELSNSEYIGSSVRLYSDKILKGYNDIWPFFNKPNILIESSQINLSGEDIFVGNPLVVNHGLNSTEKEKVRENVFPRNIFLTSKALKIGTDYTKFDEDGRSVVKNSADTALYGKYLDSRIPLDAMATEEVVISTGETGSLYIDSATTFDTSRGINITGTYVNDDNKIANTVLGSVRADSRKTCSSNIIEMRDDGYNKPEHTATHSVLNWWADKASWFSVQTGETPLTHKYLHLKTNLFSGLYTDAGGATLSYDNGSISYGILDTHNIEYKTLSFKENDLDSEGLRIPNMSFEPDFDYALKVYEEKGYDVFDVIFPKMYILLQAIYQTVISEMNWVVDASPTSKRPMSVFAPFNNTGNSNSSYMKLNRDAGYNHYPSQDNWWIGQDPDALYFDRGLYPDLADWLFEDIEDTTLPKDKNNNTLKIGNVLNAGMYDPADTIDPYDYKSLETGDRSEQWHLWTYRALSMVLEPPVEITEFEFPYTWNQQSGYTCSGTYFHNNYINHTVSTLNELIKICDHQSYKDLDNYTPGMTHGTYSSAILYGADIPIWYYSSNYWTGIPDIFQVKSYYIFNAFGYYFHAKYSGSGAEDLDAYGDQDATATVNDNATGWPNRGFRFPVDDIPITELDVDIGHCAFGPKIWSLQQDYNTPDDWTLNTNTGRSDKIIHFIGDATTRQRYNSSVRVPSSLWRRYIWRYESYNRGWDWLKGMEVYSLGEHYTCIKDHRGDEYGLKFPKDNEEAWKKSTFNKDVYDWFLEHLYKPKIKPLQDQLKSSEISIPDPDGNSEELIAKAKVIELSGVKAKSPGDEYGHKSSLQFDNSVQYLWNIGVSKRIRHICFPNQQTEREETGIANSSISFLGGSMSRSWNKVPTYTPTIIKSDVDFFGNGNFYGETLLSTEESLNLFDPLNEATNWPNKSILVGETQVNRTKERIPGSGITMFWDNYPASNSGEIEALKFAEESYNPLFVGTDPLVIKEKDITYSISFIKDYLNNLKSGTRKILLDENQDQAYIEINKLPANKLLDYIEEHNVLPEHISIDTHRVIKDINPFFYDWYSQHRTKSQRQRQEGELHNHNWPKIKDDAWEEVLLVSLNGVSVRCPIKSVRWGKYLFNSVEINTANANNLGGTVKPDFEVGPTSEYIYENPDHPDPNFRIRSARFNTAEGRLYAVLDAISQNPSTKHVLNTHNVILEESASPSIYSSVRIPTFNDYTKALKELFIVKENGSHAYKYIFETIGISNQNELATDTFALPYVSGSWSLDVYNTSVTPNVLLVEGTDYTVSDLDPTADPSGNAFGQPLRPSIISSFIDLFPVIVGMVQGNIDVSPAVNNNTITDVTDIKAYSYKTDWNEVKETYESNEINRMDSSYSFSTILVPTYTSPEKDKTWSVKFTDKYLNNILPTYYAKVVNENQDVIKTEFKLSYSVTNKTIEEGVENPFFYLNHDVLIDSNYDDTELQNLTDSWRTNILSIKDYAWSTLPNVAAATYTTYTQNNTGTNGPILFTNDYENSRDYILQKLNSEEEKASLINLFQVRYDIINEDERSLDTSINHYLSDINIQSIEDYNYMEFYSIEDYDVPFRKNLQPKARYMMFKDENPDDQIQIYKNGTLLEQSTYDVSDNQWLYRIFNQTADYLPGGTATPIVTGSEGSIVSYAKLAKRAFTKLNTNPSYAIHWQDMTIGDVKDDLKLATDAWKSGALNNVSHLDQSSIPDRYIIDWTYDKQGNTHVNIYDELFVEYQNNFIKTGFADDLIQYEIGVTPTLATATTTSAAYAASVNYQSSEISMQNLVEPTEIPFADIIEGEEYVISNIGDGNDVLDLMDKWAQLDGRNEIITGDYIVTEQKKAITYLEVSLGIKTEEQMFTAVFNWFQKEYTGSTRIPTQFDIWNYAAMAGTIPDLPSTDYQGNPVAAALSSSNWSAGATDITSTTPVAIPTYTGHNFYRAQSYYQTYIQGYTVPATDLENNPIQFYNNQFPSGGAELYDTAEGNTSSFNNTFTNGQGTRLGEAGAYDPTAGDVMKVYVNKVLQVEGVDYTATPDGVGFGAALISDEKVVVNLIKYYEFEAGMVGKTFVARANGSTVTNIPGATVWKPVFEKDSGGNDLIDISDMVEGLRYSIADMGDLKWFTKYTSKDDDKKIACVYPESEDGNSPLDLFNVEFYGYFGNKATVSKEYLIPSILSENDYNLIDIGAEPLIDNEMLSLSYFYPDGRRNFFTLGDKITAINPDVYKSEPFLSSGAKVRLLKHSSVQTRESYIPGKIPGKVWPAVTLNNSPNEDGATWTDWFEGTTHIFDSSSAKTTLSRPFHPNLSGVDNLDFTVGPTPSYLGTSWQTASRKDILNLRSIHYQDALLPSLHYEDTENYQYGVTDLTDLKPHPSSLRGFLFADKINPYRILFDTNGNYAMNPDIREWDIARVYEKGDVIWDKNKVWTSVVCAGNGLSNFDGLWIRNEVDTSVSNNAGVQPSTPGTDWTELDMTYTNNSGGYYLSEYPKTTLYKRGLPYSVGDTVLYVSHSYDFNTTKETEDYDSCMGPWSSGFYKCIQSIPSSEPTGWADPKMTSNGHYELLDTRYWVHIAPKADAKTKKQQQQLGLPAGMAFPEDPSINDTHLDNWRWNGTFWENIIIPKNIYKRSIPHNDPLKPYWFIDMAAETSTPNDKYEIITNGIIKTRLDMSSLEQSRVGYPTTRTAHTPVGATTDYVLDDGKIETGSTQSILDLDQYSIEIPYNQKKHEIMLKIKTLSTDFVMSEQTISIRNRSSNLTADIGSVRYIGAPHTSSQHEAYIGQDGYWYIRLQIHGDGTGTADNWSSYWIDLYQSLHHNAFDLKVVDRFVTGPAVVTGPGYHDNNYIRLPFKYKYKIESYMAQLKNQED